MNLLQQKGTRIVLLVMILALVLRLYMIVASSLYIPVTSDESITILQAKEIISGKYRLFMWAQPYQFPVETYMVAPIVNFLPRNGFGARFHSFVISFLSLLAMLLIFRKMASVRKTWIGILLVLFPSAYLMMIQFGYPVPHYTSAFLFWWVAIFFAIHIPRKVSGKGLMLLGITGFFCGLAFTNNMISLAIVLPIAIVVCSGNSLKRFVINIPCFGISAFAGLLPFFAGTWRYPTAHHGSVAGVRSVGYALSRLWNPTLSQTLPRALGVNVCLFPDSHYSLQHGEWLMKIITILFIMVLLYGTLLSVLRIIEEIVARKWPIFTVNEIFIGASWLGLMLFIFSKRADAQSYRYLTPVLWSFPFIIYYAYNGLPRRMKPLLAIFVIFLICFNVRSSLLLINEWKVPDYGKRVVNAPDLKPALEFLREKGIKYCVASHWAAYRIDFLSDETIICSQPQNERFRNWMVPYKDEVDSATNIAYVLTERIRFLKPNIFERHLKTMHVSSKMETRGSFKIYYDFERQKPYSEHKVPTSLIKISASNNPENVYKMIDSDQSSFWRTDRLQEKDMFLQVEFNEPVMLSQMLIYRGVSDNDHPVHMRIERKSNNSKAWENVLYRTFDKWGDKFRFKNGHPVYGDPSVQTFLFNPVEVYVLRLRIDEPRSSWAWTINELEFYLKD